MHNLSARSYIPVFGKLRIWWTAAGIRGVREDGAVGRRGRPPSRGPGLFNAFRQSLRNDPKFRARMAG